MAYPDLASLLAGSSNAELLGSTGDRQEALRLAAIAALEEYAAQSFTSEAATMAIDGNGTSRVWLPRRLSALTGLTVIGTAIGATDVEITEDHSALTIKPLDSLNYYERAMFDLDPLPRKFIRGDARVSVTGTWGWADNEFPDAVATALRLDMEDNASADANALSSTIHTMRQLGLRTITQGRMTAQLAAIGGTPALSVRAQRILGRKYVWAGRGGIAV